MNTLPEGLIQRAWWNDIKNCSKKETEIGREKDKYSLLIFSVYMFSMMFSFKMWISFCLAAWEKTFKAVKEQYVQKPSLENLLRGLYTRFDFELRFWVWTTGLFGKCSTRVWN